MATIFLLCYNEEVLLPHTIAHYKKYIPSCNIVIYDNYSTDNSVKIAQENGCKVIQWRSDGIDDFKYLTIKNNCWKNVKDGWVIVADMDEWLCVTENDLDEEKVKNTCILRVKGYNMIGQSKNVLLNDICLHDIRRCVFFPEESKSLCFYRPSIVEMNYKPGAHKCAPRINIIEYKNWHLLKKMCIVAKNISTNTWITLDFHLFKIKC
jgi:glycosyltransferase involved in cell wall biosynthesis